MRILTFGMMTLICFAGCSKLGSFSSTSGKQATGNSPGQAKGKPAPGAPPQADSTASERAKFIGTWVATAGESQGMRMGADSVRDMKWTFTPDQVSYTFFGRVLQANYVLHPDSTPPAFDFNGPETTFHGIYELNGNTLKVCFASTVRPQSFASGGDVTPDSIMLVFQKAK